MEDETTFTVHDLPQIYTKPSPNVLLITLDRLRLLPDPWDGTQTTKANHINEFGIPRYLTSIIASPLAWIKDEELREQIYKSASLRLSERSGRTAIPSITRTFRFLPSNSSVPVSITLHEPTLTADNLGHKTWLASNLLARRLPKLAPHIPIFNPAAEAQLLLRQQNKQTLQEPPPGSNGQIDSHSDSLPSIKPQVIELGAGTGLVGLTCASLYPVHVYMTDLPAIVPNLQANVDANWRNMKGTTSAEVLDWSTIPAEKGFAERFSLVVAADPLYSPDHPAWLVATIHHTLKKGKDARVIMELPLRNVYKPEIEEFKEGMHALGLLILEEGEEGGFDDWEEMDEEGEMVKVRCWWAVWGWGFAE
ncbi:MAG: hypothetical protein LQ342_005072 [Letrouitia transgressa]|nr:MAG: hypothetical protein LQ342_005072 [Letrouitia transgressa]